MKRIRKFFILSNSERWLLCSSALWIVTVHLALRLFKFETVRRKLSQYGRESSRQTLSYDRIIWAVDKMSNFLLPQRPCLTKALVAQMMLSRNGYTTTLRIGVAKKEHNKLQAHAWLENQGKIVIGYLDNLALFTPLPPLEEPKL